MQICTPSLKYPPWKLQLMAGFSLRRKQEQTGQGTRKRQVKAGSQERGGEHASRCVQREAQVQQPWQGTAYALVRHHLLS